MPVELRGVWGPEGDWKDVAVDEQNHFANGLHAGRRLVKHVHFYKSPKLSLATLQNEGNSDTENIHTCQNVNTGFYGCTASPNVSVYILWCC